MHIGDTSCMRSAPSMSRRATPASWARRRTRSQASQTLISRCRLEVGVLLERLVQLVEERALGLAVVHIGAQPRFQRRPRLEVGETVFGRADQTSTSSRYTASTRSIRLGKWRYSVPTPTPACLAIASIERAAALVGEHLARRVHEAVVVAPGIRPHGPARPLLARCSLRAWAVMALAPLSANLPLAKRRHPPYTKRRKLPLLSRYQRKGRSQWFPHVSVQQRPVGWRRHPSVVLAVILTAQLMVVLDATIVNVALPHIQRSLALFELVAFVGAQRLRPHLRRSSPPRRPLRRPARPPTDVHGRNRPVLTELAGRRIRHHQRHAAWPPAPSREWAGRWPHRPPWPS